MTLVPTMAKQYSKNSNISNNSIQITKQSDIKVIFSEFDGQIDQERIFLQENFRNYLIKSSEIPIFKKVNLYHLYLKYMSVLSRHLLQNIKAQHDEEFNLCILSNVIGSGMWGPPSEFNFWLRIDEEQNEIYSMNTMIINAVNYFQMHEGNFGFILNPEVVASFQTMINSLGKIEERQVSDIKLSLHEISTNIVSIYILLGQFKDAEELIKFFEPVCHQLELRLTVA